MPDHSLQVVRPLPIFLLIMLTFSMQLFAQNAKVGSKAYDIMLRSLLDHSVSEISVSQLGKMGNPHLLDARERNEFDVSHIENADWVGYDDFDISRVDGLPKRDTIVVYCSVGYRSEKVAEKIKAAGYSHVYNLYGGIFEWKNEGQKVVDNNGRPTEKVHAYDKTWGVWLKEGDKVYGTK